ncbi:MAG: hypothetical protein AB7G93_19135 [Bdellovibrionales bacterium]
MSRIVAALAALLASAFLMQASVSTAAEARLWKVSAENHEVSFLDACDETLVAQHILLKDVTQSVVTQELAKKYEKQVDAYNAKLEAAKTCEDFAAVHNELKSLLATLVPDMTKIHSSATTVDGLLETPEAKMMVEMLAEALRDSKKSKK